MTEPTHECPDLDRLIRLIGILGSPTEPGFWDSWRTDSDGYGFGKIKAGIAKFAKSSGSYDNHDYRAHDFANYVLMLFATDTPEQEQKLADTVGRYISSGSPLAVGTRFLADLRATAWRLWRDHHGVETAEVIQQWVQAPFPWEREKWAALRED